MPASVHRTLADGMTIDCPSREIGNTNILITPLERVEFFFACRCTDPSIYTL